MDTRSSTSKNIGVYLADAIIATKTMVTWQKIAKFPRYVDTVRKLDMDIPKNPLALIVYIVYHANLENTTVTLSAVPKTESKKNPSKFIEMATNHSSLSALSWNINGGVLNKLALLENIVEKHDIV